MSANEATVLVALIGLVGTALGLFLTRQSAKETAKNEERRLLIEEMKAKAEGVKEIKETVDEAAKAWQGIAEDALLEVAHLKAKIEALEAEKKYADAEPKTDD